MSQNEERARVIQKIKRTLRNYTSICKDPDVIDIGQELVLKWNLDKLNGAQVSGPALCQMKERLSVILERELHRLWVCIEDGQFVLRSSLGVGQ